MNAHLDCFAGICGNMFLGALVDAGVEVAELREIIAGLSIRGYQIDCRRVDRAGISATHVEVHCEEASGHRRLDDCLEVIAGGGIPGKVEENAARVFSRLAEAEAEVHGVDVNQVHFHEVGATDAIIDIVGSCWGLHRLEIEKLTHGVVNVGDGVVTCDHGTYPVPPPAVLLLLTGRPITNGYPGITGMGELTTPTGAALVAVLSQPAAAGSPRTVIRAAYGAGDRNPAGFPNCLRLNLVTDTIEPVRREPIVELVCDIDDLNPEWFAAAEAAARRAGAVDVTLTPTTTKGGRPATRLTALASPDEADKVEAALFRHTTTFGVRRRNLSRTCLTRRWIEVETPYGRLRIKEGWLGKERLQASPEYRDCFAVAQEHDVAVAQVYRAALANLPAPDQPPEEDWAP